MTSREVKIIFALADAMKSPTAWDDNTFAVELQSKKDELESLTEAQLDNKLGWPKRKQLYESHHKWTLGNVPLRDCWIEWSNGFGDRGSWAKGHVPVVADEIRKRNDQKDRVWVMANRLDVFFRKIPIICTKIDKGWSIDDGCNRAIAAFIAGKDAMPACLGQK